MIKTLDERGEREADQQKLRVFFFCFWNKYLLTITIDKEAGRR